MKVTRVLALFAFLAASATANADNLVTFWVRGTTPMDAANTKIVTLDKMPGKVKLGKACAGKAGNFDGWQAMSVDPRGERDGQIVDIVSGTIPGHAEVLASIRQESTCTEGGVTWTKYTGIPEKPFRRPGPPAKKPAKTVATPKPAPTGK